MTLPRISCEFFAFFFCMVYVNFHYVNSDVYNFSPLLNFTGQRIQVKQRTIGKLFENILSEVTKNGNPITGIINGAGNIVSGAGNIVSGNIVGGAGNIVGGVVEPVKGILSSGSHLVTGSVSQVMNTIGYEVKAIYPGTRWCGDGDRATDINDLGLFEKVDSCCRSHDMCSDNIEAGKTKYALVNNGIFTRSHCQCDVNFYNCLKNTGSVVGLKIGTTYFNVLSPQCFKYEYPATCVQYGRTLLMYQKCLQYQYDYNQSPRWQWFDNSNYV